MPRAEAGSMKAVANAMKAKGLTKLRFYCQICQKACRDENGYKCHIESEAHMRQIDVVSSSGNSHKVIDEFSSQFQKEFVSLLSRRFGTRRIKANQVYQEHIADRHHLHMNATKWLTLSEFVKHLGLEGIVQAEETEQGWFITWIDNSPAALARQDALQKMDRAKMDDEQRQRKYLQEQIQRAEKETRSESRENQKAKAEEGLKRETGSGPLKIAISLHSGASTREDSEGKPVPSTSDASLSTSEKPTPLKFSVNPFKTMSKSALPLASKPASTNAFKTGASSGSNGKSDVEKKRSKPPSSLTMAEKIMMEEMERKKRKAEGGGSSVGPVMQQGVKRSRF